MRAALACAVLGAALWAAVLHADSPEPDGGESAAVGYDHVWHQGRVAVSGQAEPACTRCHRVDARGRLSGRPDHGACFGDCHGPAPRRPSTIAAGVRRVCLACHAPADLDALEAGEASRIDVAYPPYTRDPDHGVTMSHAAHDRPTRDQGDCLACHPAPADPADPGPGGTGKQRAAAAGNRAPDAHARCAGCHAAKAPATAPTTAEPTTAPTTAPTMDRCLGCHVPAYGPRTRPHLVRGDYPVTRTFSHTRHRAHGTTTCRICHSAVAASASVELPTPAMATCQTCHDGEQAFSAVAPHCRRCHTRPRGGTDLRPPLAARYDHAVHDRVFRGRDAGTIPGCATCHVLDARGVPTPPAADHAPCSDAACHGGEFASSEPEICGACHVGTEPWRPLHFDRAPRSDTEFGARFSHRAHVSHVRERGMERGCADCHGRARGSDAMRLSRDHRGCMGGGCHTRTGGASPGLSECDACHQAGLVRQRRDGRMRARWSVRGRFRHEPHRLAPGTGRPVACTSCHVGVDRARAMDDIPAPAKGSCRPCHDGEAAFKVTGHGCARCHGGAAGDRDTP